MDIAEFLANFLRRIVKKMGQKLILEYNFKNKNSDDFYVLQLCFFDSAIKKSLESKVVVHKKSLLIFLFIKKLTIKSQMSSLYSVKHYAKVYLFFINT